VQSPRDTLTAIAAADLVVHPSPVEIFGNVLAEAMALRTPIIAMRAGGNMEMLGDESSTAMLLDGDSSASFADAILELRANPARRAALANAAHERLVTVFPLSRMIDGYEAMMQQIVGDEAGAK
jgi:glycosyltransferase involved in cell wall biosynthesis